MIAERRKKRKAELSREDTGLDGEVPPDYTLQKRITSPEGSNVFTFF